MTDHHPNFRGEFPAEYLRSMWWIPLIKGVQDATPIFGHIIRNATLKKIINRVQDGHKESVRFLAYVYIKTDYPHIRRKAEKTLSACEKNHGLRQIWQAYAETRHPALEDLLLKFNQPSDVPLKNYVLSILLLNDLKTIKALTLNPKAIHLMVDYCDDQDPRIAEKAQQTVLARNTTKELDALVNCFIQTGNAYALQAIRTHNHLPEDIRRRTMLAFLTEDLHTYDLLDFDRRVLTLVYQEGSPELRRRIIRIIQANGRADLLPIVTGKKETSRIEELSAEESQVLIEMHRGAQNWPRLWALMFELTPKWSLIAFRSLLRSGYEPSNPDDQRLFHQLRDLNPSLPDPETLNEKALFPPAFKAATIKVPGRINDIAFAPNASVIALGTGLGKVALWDYEKAEMIGILTKFDHSVGNVAYTNNGALICGERANPDMPCAIRIYKDSRLTTLGQHAHSIQALSPAGANRLISTASDRQISLWDTERMHLIQSRSIYPYPRAVAPWPSGNRALLISKTLDILDLTTMQHEGLNRRVRPGKHAALYRSGTGTSAAFHPNGREFFLGLSNGLVWHYQQEGKTFYCSGTQVTSNIKQVRNLFYLKEHNNLITGAGEGTLQLIAWPSGQIHHKIQLPEQNLTSFHLSPDQTVMATGNADAEMSLWDLRALKLADLSKYSLAGSTPAEITTIRNLRDEISLVEDAKNVLSYIEYLLLHRHRNDIEIAKAPQIKRGQFDIILNEE